MDSWGRRPWGFRRWALLGGLLTLGVGPWARADLDGTSQARLSAVLSQQRTEALTLTWTQGRAEAPQRVLKIEGGKAQLQLCRPDCVAVGASVVLTSGQRGRLESGLRSVGLGSLRTADPEARAAADRALDLQVDGRPAGLWQLQRADWPTPSGADDGGLAGYLDELTGTLLQAAQARPLTAIPTSVAQLHSTRVQLRVLPTSLPGGLLVIEHGVLRVEPAEGSLPRSPRPQKWQRALAPAEQEQLLAALQAAGLEALEASVPRRAAPAIGDADGRLALLHLMSAPLEGGTKPGPAARKGKQARGASPPVAVAPEPKEQPRGLQRYVADLSRSTAAPLLKQLLGYLTALPPATKGAQVAGAPHKPSGM